MLHTVCKTPLSALQGWTCSGLAGGEGIQKFGVIEKKAAAHAEDVVRDMTVFPITWLSSLHKNAHRQRWLTLPADSARFAL